MEDYKKKYEEALDNFKKIKAANKYNNELVDFIEYKYPELKESKDERIRNFLISKMKEVGNVWKEYSSKDIIAWLEKQGEKLQGKTALEAWKDMRFEIYQQASGNRHEPNYSDDSTKMFSLTDIDEIFEKIAEKQGEQKPADYENPNIQQNDFAPKSAMEAIKKEKVDNSNKVEQKFKEGDWVVYQNQTFQVTKNSGNNLILQGRRYQTYFIEELCKPWTIDDAKDGDVLSFNDGHGNDSIELIKSITDKKIEFWFCLTNSNRYEVFDGITPYTNIVSRKDATPATKEQRDKLEKAMVDAGYTFDFEKKELKKIEKPAKWSEEDEEMFHEVCCSVKYTMVNRITCTNELGEEQLNWLKSLKERIKTNDTTRIRK